MLIFCFFSNAILFVRSSKDSTHVSLDDFVITCLSMYPSSWSFFFLVKSFVCRVFKGKTRDMNSSVCV